jgi:bifunctional DNA-binding transcriptional regulator/antitoxin component of YhaV-PrlF toxin-antitoxin module
MEAIGDVPRLVKVRSRGQLTIPNDVRQALQIDDRTGLTMLRVGEVLIMTPKRLQRVTLAREMEKQMKKDRLTLEDLLLDLKGQRKRYLAETYPED